MFIFVRLMLIVCIRTPFTYEDESSPVLMQTL